MEVVVNVVEVNSTHAQDCLTSVAQHVEDVAVLEVSHPEGELVRWHCVLEGFIAAFASVAVVVVCHLLLAFLASKVEHWPRLVFITVVDSVNEAIDNVVSRRGHKIFILKCQLLHLSDRDCVIVAVASTIDISERRDLF